MRMSMYEWDVTDIRKRLCHALDISAQTVEQLAQSGYTDALAPANNLRPEKVISETALLLLAASGASRYPEVKGRIYQVALQLAPYARSERMLLGVCLEPAVAVDYAQAHICLSRMGFPDEDFDRVLRQSLRSQAASGRERPPHRMLEQLWFDDLRLTPTVRSRSAANRLAKQSLLCLPMDLLKGSREDIYAFTHALLYINRFHHFPLRLPRRRSDILAEAAGLLARCLDNEDYDLSGELLLAWPLTHNSWSVSATFGFHVLARVEDAAGFLPAPTTRLGQIDKLEGNARLKYLLATAYHTVYVMGLLCSAALLPGCAPPARIPVAGAIPDAASRILNHLSVDTLSIHWCEVFRLLDNRERDALAGFLLEVALFRCVKKHDFESLHRVLEAGYLCGLVSSPVASQAAEMLQRLTALNRIDGDQPAPGAGVTPLQGTPPLSDSSLQSIGAY